ncbi:DbpA RNA binding domain-containing protein, partial [Proteus terrae]|uniref:DbpA RNA binding domain-containing protein n=1 Tax=Proteus terrae TaxID=1574161 RepID=UPI003315930C
PQGEEALDMETLAAVLLKMAQGERALILPPDPVRRPRREFNERDISSRYIGNIKLYGSHSTIELPKGMPTDLLSHFTRTRIMNKP